MPRAVTPTRSGDHGDWQQGRRGDSCAPLTQWDSVCCGICTQPAWVNMD